MSHDKERKKEQDDELATRYVTVTWQRPAVTAGSVNTSAAKD